MLIKSAHHHLSQTEIGGDSLCCRQLSWSQCSSARKVCYSTGEFHPESKCADSQGNPCTKETVGLLQRRHIKIDGLKYIGKESNSLEEVESGLIQSERNIYTEYTDPRRDEWTTKLSPLMRKIPLKLLVRACKGHISRRALIDMRAGRSRPHRKNQEFLKPIIQKLAQTPSVRRNLS